MRDFVIAMSEAGLEPPSSVYADGRLHRFAVGEEQKKSGWYVLHADPLAGAYGCWKTGLNKKWSTTKEYTDEEKQEFKLKMECDKRERIKRQMKKQEDCRLKSAQVWENAEPQNEHEYIRRKGIKPYGVKFHLDSVVVPVRDIHGVMHGLQFIRQDGTKRFMTGTAKKGCYMSMGKLADTVCICEGYATGASIHESTGYPVAVAFDAGNLVEVASVFRRRFEKIKIILCADNDHVGISKSAVAAAHYDCTVVYPDGEGMDFNDVHVKYGPEAVKNLII